MAVIFREDFETGTTSMTITTNQPGNTVEVTNVNPINGAYSARCHAINVADWSGAFLSKTISPISKAYAEVLLRLESFTPSRGDSRVEHLLSFGSNMFICSVVLTSDRHLCLRYLHTGSVLIVISTKVLDLNVVYKIGLEASVGTNASITVTVDGVAVPELTITGIDNSAASPISRVGTGVESWAAEVTAAVDDFVIAESMVVTHKLTVDSTPIKGVPVTVDATSVGYTPLTITVEEGTHQISVPSEVTA
jgi:hypothetical protein